MYLQFGIIVCINLAIGLVTPPYGCNLFVASAVAEIPMGKMVGYVLKLMIALVAVLLLITYIPALSLCLL